MQVSTTGFLAIAFCTEMSVDLQSVHLFQCSAHFCDILQFRPAFCVRLVTVLSQTCTCLLTLVISTIIDTCLIWPLLYPQNTATGTLDNGLNAKIYARFIKRGTHVGRVKGN